MKTNEIYMRFLELAKALENSSTLPILEPLEEKMMRMIAVANIKNERLSVKDMMAKSELSSPATVHKNIHALIKKRWIYLEDTEDARRKQLQLTSEAKRHFVKLEKMMDKAIKNYG